MLEGRRTLSDEVDVPVTEDGEFDLETQMAIAAKGRIFDAVRSRIAEVGIDANTRKFSREC